MTYFNRGGGFGGGRDSGRPSFSNRDRSDRPEMHRAICDQCGKECEVPFRPNGSKPIYCSQCFETKNGGSDRGGDRTTVRRFDRDGSSRPSGRDFNRSDSRSFGNNNFGGREEGVLKIASNNEEMAALNRKLDQIIELLTPKKETVAPEVVSKKAPKKTKKAEVTE
jgi:CxxC-x17-CxxC domain-containing protein